jgi:hypothetical protein
VFSITGLRKLSKSFNVESGKTIRLLVYRTHWIILEGYKNMRETQSELPFSLHYINDIEISHVIQHVG